MKKLCYLMLIVGLVLASLFTNWKAEAQSSGYLKTYEDNNFQKPMQTYTFTGQEGPFVSWPDRENDKLSSFTYMLPVGWEVRLYKHRDESKQHHPFRGTGSEVRVNQSELGWLKDGCSGHKFVKSVP